MANKKLKVKSEKLKVKKAPKIASKSVKKTTKAEAKVVVVKTDKKGSLNVSVLDIKGKVAGSLELPKEIFGVKINNSLMSQAVRVYLTNQRQGTSKTKDRGEVNATTKKVWQQKGTGRARHGSKRAPIFVGGGVAFGPKPRDFSLTISKKMKKNALFSALSSKLKENEIKIVKGLEAVTPKTKIMNGILKNLGIEERKKTLLVMPKAGSEFNNVLRAARNIEGVRIVSANNLNTYSVLDNKLIILMRDAVSSIKDSFLNKKEA